MKQIANITGDAFQRHTIIIDSGEIVLQFRYCSVTQLWFMDVEYNGGVIKGVKLSLGVRHINAQNWPFDFVIEDTSGNDIDPFQLSDFVNGRILLYMLEADEVEEIRGYGVRLQ